MTPVSDFHPPALPSLRQSALALMDARSVVAVEVGSALVYRADVKASDETAAQVLRQLRERA